jgi:DNA segregation ATPase FtsK/SpoIIIE-like protein
MAIRFKFGKDKSEVIRDAEPEPDSRVISSRDGQYIQRMQQAQAQQIRQMQQAQANYQQPPQELPPYPQQQAQAQPQQQEPTPEQKILMQKYLDFVKENGVYNLDDFRNLYQAEICNLLFGILQELKRLNK